MSANDLIALLPLAHRRRFVDCCHAGGRGASKPRLTAALAFIGLAAAFASLWIAGHAVPLQVTPLLMLDRYALFYIGLILAASMAFVLLSYGYLSDAKATMTNSISCCSWRRSVPRSWWPAAISSRYFSDWNYSASRCTG